MENASKALIIAGAILLSILIIGLGMMIFNQAKDAIGNTGMDQQKIATYNSDFEDYMGKNVKGSQVQTLYNTVRNHNIANQDDDSLIISINDKSTTTDLNTDRASIKAGKTYTVEVPADGYDSKTGYIVKITVTENK